MLEKYLIIQDREKKALEQLDQYRLLVKSSKDLQKDGEIQIFRWRDVEKLISAGVISRNMSIDRSGFRKTSGEHCAFFGNTSWEEKWEVEYYEPFNIRCNLDQFSMWGDIEDHWNPQRTALSPVQTDLIRFKEFCYQFDPSFRQSSTPEEHLRVYTSVAWAWAANLKQWNGRPWAERNFPTPPHSCEANLTVEDKFVYKCMRSLLDSRYYRYQCQCRKYRALFRALPKILFSRPIWRTCMRDLHNATISEAVEVASRAVLKSKKKTRPVELEFHRIRPREVNCTRYSNIDRTLAQDQEFILVEGDIAELDNSISENSVFGGSWWD
jgi:hypothetical protein